MGKSARSGRLLVTWLAVVGLLWPAVDGKAQEYTDTTSVVVVEVPVNVTTRDGEPITGLTADDFEILDQGKRQQIIGFDVVDLRQEDSRAEIQETSPAARRHFVFVFDLSFSEPNAIARARQAALDVVRSSLHPGDLISVATYSTRRGPQLALNFTTDRRLVERALSTLGLTSGGKPIVDPFQAVIRSSSVSTGIDEGVTSDEGGGPGGGLAGGGLAPDDEIEELVSMLEGDSRQADLRARVDNFASTFGFLAELLAPLDGRKHIVFLSEGFDASVLFGSADRERLDEMQRKVELGEIWDVDTDERFGSGAALTAVNELLKSFRQADATIHSIDIARLSTEEPSPSSRGRQDGLFLLADETSGEFYRNFSDLSEAMDEMLEATSVTYVLAFQPDLKPGRDDFRRLKVRLKDAPRGTNLSYRQGYYPPAAFADMSEAQRQMRALQDMMRGGSSTALHAQVLTASLATGSGGAYVPLLLEIPASQIGRFPLTEELTLQILAYATDAEGTVHDQFEESLIIDVDKVRGELEESGVKFYGHLDLEPGDYAVRILVRDGRTGSTSVDVVPLEVPDFAATSLAVMPPLVPEDTERWVLILESAERAENRTVEYPFMFKGQSFVPAVRPLFRPGQVVAVSLVAATSSGQGRLEVGALVLEADGTPVPGTFLRVLEREQDPAAGLERLIAAFEVPSLPSGEYQLVVTMSDPVSGDVDSGSLEFVLGQQGQQTAGFRPPQWMPDLSEIVRQLGPSTSEARVIKKIDKDAVRASYAKVLRQLADGRRMGAVLALAELEGSSVSDDNPMATLNQIAKVEHDVLEGITRRDPELLLPAILLHREAYSQYRLRKEPFLAVKARTTTLELVDEYVKRSRRSDARELASRLLTAMAAEVYGSGAHISARAMFDRAIELDGTNGVALLGLGFMYESMGQGDLKTPRYEDAVERLEQAVEAEPTLHEARLRLAINLGRVGRDVDAGRHLQLLVDREDVPSWVLSLAYQELARLYMKKGAFEEARRVLERAVERLPGDSKLSLQLAYVYERCRQPYEAARASERAIGDSLSARFLYLKVPQQLEQAGTAWTEMATSRLPALSAALSRAETGVGR